MLKKITFTIFLSLFTLNSTFAINFTKNIEPVKSVEKNLNNLQIQWIDKYLETIILNLNIKKIDLELAIFDTLEKDKFNNQQKTLFLSDNIQLQQKADCLKIHKNRLLNELETLNNELKNYKNIDLILTNNDFNIDKILKSNNFQLKNDNLEMVNTIKNYQKIIIKNDKTIQNLRNEIQQYKRSEFDIHFVVLNKLENQIFLKKFVKIYLIEKLKQQPIYQNLKEINSYLEIPIKLI